MANSQGWTVSVTGALWAHFKQPNGSSRAGADWAVTLTSASEQKQVLVRTYADEVGAMADLDEARLVIAHVERLLESGWSPRQYKGEPGELVVPPQATQRPWWRFW